MNIVVKDDTKQIRNLKSSQKSRSPILNDNLVEVRKSLASLMVFRTTRHPYKMYAVKHNIFSREVVIKQTY